LYDVHAVADIVSDRCNLRAFNLKHDTEKYFHRSYVPYERLIYPTVLPIENYRAKQMYTSGTIDLFCTKVGKKTEVRGRRINGG